MSDQLFGNVHGTRTRGQHQNRLALLIRCLHIRARIEQHFDQVSIGNLYRLCQRTRPVVIDDIRPRPTLKEHSNQFGSDIVDRPVQWRGAVSLRNVHIGAGIDQLQRGIAFLGLHQVGKCAIRGGRANCDEPIDEYQY